MSFSEPFAFNGVEYVIESEKGKHRFHVVNTEIFGQWLDDEDSAEIEFMKYVFEKRTK